MGQEKRTRTISDEERQRRSERAKAMHREKIIDPETGQERPKFGGAENARKGAEKRASKSIAEAVDDRAEDIQDALFAGLDKRNTPDVRRRAAKELLGIARQERLDEISERRALDEENRTAILDRVLRRLELGQSGSGDVLEGGLPRIGQGRTGPDPDGVYELGDGEWSED